MDASTPSNLRRYRQRLWTDVHVDDVLDPGVETLDVERVVMSAAATLTYFGGHIDVEYAKSQGRKHIYLPTGAVVAFVDAHVCHWAGPEAFLVKRRVRMNDSVYAGDRLEVNGTVTKKWKDDSGRHLIEVATVMTTGGPRPCVTADSWITLPAA